MVAVFVIVNVGVAVLVGRGVSVGVWVLVGCGVNVGVFVDVGLGVREAVGVAERAAINAFTCAVLAAEVASRLRSIVGVDEGTVAVGDGV